MTRLPSFLRPLFPVAKQGVVFMTALIAPLSRRLPTPRDRLGTPRFATLSTCDFAWTHPDGGIEVTEVEPEMTLDRPLPAGLPADHWAFAAKQNEDVPTNVVAKIRNGRVVDHYGAVISEDDTLLFDLSPYFGIRRPPEHPIFLRASLPALEEVDNALAVLTTRGADNYYHFLTDVLPRLELLDRAGATPDRYLVDRGTRFQRELLDQLGLTEDRCLQSVEHPHVRARELIVPSLPDADLKTPPWIVPWLRDKFLPSDLAPPHRRLYLGRGNKRHTRRVTNEAELLAALEPLGFESIDPGTLSAAEQVRAFAEAELVVGAHGAALTNIAFCPDGAGVIELFPPDYVNVCYWALACTMPRLRYRYLIGDGRPTRVRSNRGVASDVRVDPRQVIRLLDQLT
jgi:capsular polysaccharide biosynthesis protein